MAHSLSEECTPLKREYDTCFNAWFEGYLEPAVAATPEQRTQYSQDKAAEYERNCGKIWVQYRECVQVIALHHAFLPELRNLPFCFCDIVFLVGDRMVQKAVKEKGLDVLLDQARAENPLKEPPPTPSPDKAASSS